MKHAYLFPGQGSQFAGMGHTLYEQNEQAKKLFHIADEILGFNISSIMFHGKEEDLRQTNVTQPAVFLHSVIAYKTIVNPNADMTAGHSLGEFSALVANGALKFEDALNLVNVRAGAMQKACEKNPSTMAAILGLDDETVALTCAKIMQDTGETVVAANFNCPGQVVISGSIKGVDLACVRLKNAGAKRALVLPVGGAFHSPLMEPAREELSFAIKSTSFYPPIFPVYQNVVAAPVTDADEIRQNLIVQLTGPVRWTQTIEAMVNDGATHYTEVGPGKVLQGLTKKIFKEAMVLPGIN